jgi:hypothetical protein
MTERSSSRVHGSRHIPREHHAFNVNGRSRTRPVGRPPTPEKEGEQHIPEKSRHSSYRNPTLGGYTEAPHVSEVTPNKFDSSELSTPRRAILRIFRQLGCKPYRRRSSYPSHRHVDLVLDHSNARSHMAVRGKGYPRLVGGYYWWVQTFQSRTSKEKQIKDVMA